MFNNNRLRDGAANHGGGASDKLHVRPQHGATETACRARGFGDERLGLTHESDGAFVRCAGIVVESEEPVVDEGHALG